MNKNQIIQEAQSAGWRATYSSRLRRWFFERLWRSTNTRAFDAVVLANLKRRWGIIESE